MQSLGKSKVYLSIFLISLLVYLLRGLLYAFIGSYIPMILPIVVLLAYTILRNRTKFIIKTWAILLISWAVVRMFIGAVNYFGKALTENHLHQQLGIQGMLVNTLVLWVGIYLIRNSKNLIKGDHLTVGQIK